MRFLLSFCHRDDDFALSFICFFGSGKTLKLEKIFVNPFLKRI